MITERRHPRSKLWPGMIFALIGLNFTVVGLTIYASSRRASSHAVEPDYDRKALNWNQSARQVAHNKELGWSIQITELSAGVVAVALCGRDNLPLGDAEVTVEAFHHAHAADRIALTLTATPDGYRAPLTINEAGLWEFRFTARQAGETLTATITRILAEQVP